MTFLEKWHAATQHSRLAIGIAPRVVDLPAPIVRYDAPFMPFSHAIIDATAEHACAYVFDFASFMAQGAAGAIALERSVPAVPAPCLKILHVPLVTADYVPMATTEGFFFDAVTLATHDPDVVAAYAQNGSYGAFVPEHGAQPGHATYSATHLTYDGIRVRWVTDEIIYASGTANFADTMRRAAQRYQAESLAP